MLLKLTQAVSPTLQQGAYQVYRFFSTVVTYPLLFAIGVSLTPWDKLMAAFQIGNIVTIVSFGWASNEVSMTAEPAAIDLKETSSAHPRVLSPRHVP